MNTATLNGATLNGSASGSSGGLVPIEDIPILTPFTRKPRRVVAHVTIPAGQVHEISTEAEVY